MATGNAAGADATGKGDAKERIETFVSKANDIGEAREFVNGAASVAYGLWLTYLGILIYVAVAAGAVTDEDLFLERPVKLPFVSESPLPLVAFFALAPFVFVAWHCYTLLHFDILAVKIRALEKQLKYPDDLEKKKAEDLLRFRMQLPANIFVQLSAVPQLNKGWIGFISRSIDWISLVVAPIFLLLLIQIRFLPFHSWPVTSWQRILVLADLTLLWTFWLDMVGGEEPGLVERLKRVRARRRGGWTLVVAGCATIFTFFVSVVWATFPGEWMDAKLEWIPPNRLTGWLGARDDLDQPVWTSFHDLLFSLDYDEHNQRRRSLFSNTLVLPNFDGPGAVAVDESKLGERAIARKFGHFEGAVFRGANLRKVNFENAHLEGANFYQANLQDAQMYQADLYGADFYQAKRERASFGEAQLGRAILREADLDGAFLYKAGLQGATLEGAKLGGATLAKARLQGASLDKADAPGADFGEADLRGARLRGMQLDDGSLQAASFQVASFKNARLEGACLDKAQLAGADFSDAKLGRARLNSTNAWHTNFVRADVNRVLAASSSLAKPKDVDIDKLRARVARSNDALGRIDKLLNASTPAPPFEPLPGTGKMSPEDIAGEQQALADQLLHLVCEARDEEVGDVVHGLIRDGSADSIIRETGPKAKGLIEQILSLNCLATAYLTSDDRTALSYFGKNLPTIGAPR